MGWWNRIFGTGFRYRYHKYSIIVGTAKYTNV